MLDDSLFSFIIFEVVVLKATAMLRMLSPLLTCKFHQFTINPHHLFSTFANVDRVSQKFETYAKYQVHYVGNHTLTFTL